MNKKLTDEQLSKNPKISQPMRDLQYDKVMEEIEEGYNEGKDVYTLTEELFERNMMDRVICKQDITDYFYEKEEQQKSTLNDFLEKFILKINKNAENDINKDDLKEFYTKEELSFIINLMFKTNITPRRTYELIYNKLHISGNNKLYCKKTEKNKVVYNLNVISLLFEYIENEIDSAKTKILNGSFECSIKDLFDDGTIITENCVETAILNDTKFIEERCKKYINELKIKHLENIQEQKERYEEKINKQKQQIDDYKHLVDELVDKLELITFEKGKCKGYLEEFKSKDDAETLNRLSFSSRR